MAEKPLVGPEGLHAGPCFDETPDAEKAQEGEADDEKKPKPSRLDGDMG